jgi:hypothetical protein
LERAEGWMIPYVFHRNGELIRNYYGAWRAACARAAVGRQLGPLTVVERPDLTGRLVHDCRRSSVRNLVRPGVPDYIAMKLSGHATRTIFDRYNIVNAEDLRSGAAKLAAHLSGNAGTVPKGTDDGQRRPELVSGSSR